MAPVLTNSITVALKVEQFEAIQAEADRRGLTLAEVARPILTRAFSPDPIETLVLAECWATRELMMACFVALADGQSLSPATIQKLAASVDGEKLVRARALLASEGPR